MSSWVTGLAGEPATGAEGLEFRDGAAVTPQLQLVAGFAGSAPRHYSPDPTMNETTSWVTLGVHWLPFAGDTAPRDRFTMENFYVTADLGYAWLDRGMGTDLGRITSGFAAGAGVGWSFHLTRGLGMGAELGDQVLFFTNDDIAAHSLAATVFAEIYPSFRF